MTRPQKRKGGSKFVALYRWMTESDAWLSLSPNARSTYLLFGERYNGFNNGSISLSIRQIARGLGVGKNAAHAALLDLVDRRFIEVVKPSGFNRKDRTATEYRLTEHKCNRTNRPASKAFMKWKSKNLQSRHKETTVPS